MLRNIQILIASLLFTSSFLTTVHAQQDLFEFELKQAIAEQHIKNCNVEQFKTEYAALQTEFQRAQEQRTVLEALEQIAQETKKEKITDLAKFITRSACEKYWLFAKLGAQALGAAICSISALSRLFDILKAPNSATDDDVGCLIITSSIGGSCGYFAQNNYRTAFQQKK